MQPNKSDCILLQDFSLAVLAAKGVRSPKRRGADRRMGGLVERLNLASFSRGCEMFGGRRAPNLLV